MYKLYNDDCLKIMPQLADKSVDMILCDLPYGVLNKSNPGAKWDSLIPFDSLWANYERLIKDNGVIVLFASGMFTAKLMLSKPELWRYNLIWKKGNRVSGFLNAKKQPLRNHEDICVFYKKQPTYNPQMVVGSKNHSVGSLSKTRNNNCYGEFKLYEDKLDGRKYPKSILEFEKEHPQQYHPTQKPIALLEYLIKTYTNVDDLVLDNCMGSGSTGVACVSQNRNFIGIELQEDYYNIAVNRIESNNRFSVQKFDAEECYTTGNLFTML